MPCFRVVQAFRLRSAAVVNRAAAVCGMRLVLLPLLLCLVAVLAVEQGAFHIDVVLFVTRVVLLVVQSEPHVRWCPCACFRFWYAACVCACQGLSAIVLLSAALLPTTQSAGHCHSQVPAFQCVSESIQTAT